MLERNPLLKDGLITHVVRVSWQNTQDFFLLSTSFSVNWYILLCFNLNNSFRDTPRCSGWIIWCRLGL